MRDKNYLRSTKIVATVGTATDDIEKMLEDSIETTMSNGKVMHVVISKKWVFSVDSDGDFDWEGMLNDDGESFTECDPPKDLLELYNDSD